MRLTQRLCSGLRDISVRRWNKVWACRGKFYDYPAAIPESLTEKGIEVVSASEILKPDLPKWTPPVADDPRFMEPVPPEEREDWKEEPAYTFHKRLRLFEGVKQACLLAKAQHIEALPASVEKLLGAVEISDRDILLQRYIMQSQVWNPSEDKLPKRYDSRKPGWKFQRQYGIRPHHSSSILLRNLLRLSRCQSSQFESSSYRLHVADSVLHSHVIYKGRPIVLNQSIPFMVMSDAPLAPLGDENVVDSSVSHVIPDMWPAYPTVDFIQSNNYELNNLAGLTEEIATKRLFPHTLLDITYKSFWDDTHIQGNQVMSCLMTAAAMARHKYGNDVTILPEPISIQHIGLRETRLVFTYFQLNTLDLDSDAGVKNLVWTGQPYSLCDKVLGQPWMPRPMKKTRLLNYDGSVFDTFLATYLNGIDINKS